MLIRTLAKLTTAIFILPAILIPLFTAAADTPGSESATTEGGQTIQLHPDGRWQPENRHRFAITDDGKRVRLNDDGSWEETTDLRPATATADAKLTLAGVEILIREVNRGKGKHRQTRTRFSVAVTNQTDRAISLPAQRHTVYNNFIARSSRGDLFPIIAVSGCTLPLQEQEQCVVTVTAKGSPAWFGVTSLELQVLPNTLGNTTSRTLSTPYKQVQHRQVNRFDV